MRETNAAVEAVTGQRTLLHLAWRAHACWKKQRGEVSARSHPLVGVAASPAVEDVVALPRLGLLLGLGRVLRGGGVLGVLVDTGDVVHGVVRGCKVVRRLVLLVLLLVVLVLLLLLLLLRCQLGLALSGVHVEPGRGVAVASSPLFCLLVHNLNLRGGEAVAGNPGTLSVLCEPGVDAEVPGGGAGVGCRAATAASREGAAGHRAVWEFRGGVVGGSPGDAAAVGVGVAAPGTAVGVAGVLAVVGGWPNAVFKVGLEMPL